MRMRRRGDALVSTGWMKTEFDAVAVIFYLYTCVNQKKDLLLQTSLPYCILQAQFDECSAA